MAGWLGAFYVKGMDEKDSACMSNFNTIYQKETPVMQFTGLLDRNGKEIFEGDVVRQHCSSNEKHRTTATIIWDDGTPGFFVLTHDKQISDYRGKMVDMPTMHSWCGGHSCWDYLEIIGNIYENPELTEVKE